MTNLSISLLGAFEATLAERPLPHFAPKASKAQLTPMVDIICRREEEMAAITNLISHNRLVMLTGVGGIGKTNLCLQVGQQMLDTFPDGVWFVELAPLADPALVGQTAAHTLGLCAVSQAILAEAQRIFTECLQMLVDEETFARVYEAGQAMTREQILAYLLEDVG